MPIKGLEKGDGVPPLPVAMAGQVGEEGKNLSLYIIIRHRSCSLWREWDCYSSEPKEKSSCLTNEKVMLR